MGVLLVLGGGVSPGWGCYSPGWGVSPVWGVLVLGGGC